MDPENPISTLPIEIMTKIFSFLPRRERFMCMCMCPRWRQAMDVPYLWKHISVRLDVDFFEVSTIQLTIEFCKYMKSLELRFEYSDEPMQWINYRMLDITKRTYRFLSIFINKNLQIHNLTFTNFCVFYKTKKILYYLTMFLRSQNQIKMISFNGSFFTKKTFIRLLTSSLSTNHKSIRQLDMQNSYYESDYHSNPNNENGGATGQINILSSQLMMSVTSIEFLTVLRIDFESLIFNDILNGFLYSNCVCLEVLDIRVSEHDLKNVGNMKIYPNSIWLNLLKKYSRLKVSMTFCNVVYEYSCLEMIFSRSVPLFSLTWTSSSFIPKHLLEECAKKYSHTLERVKLNANKSHLNEALIVVLKNCANLMCLEFSGLVNNIPNLQEIFLGANFTGFKSYEIYVRASKLTGELLVHDERIMKETTMKSRRFPILSFE